jgi:DnaK suppressor protein
MNDNNFYKDLILKSITDVSEEIKNMKEMTKPISPDNAIGRLSRMEALNEKSINEASLRNLELRLLLLNQALKRIHDGDYGECLICEEEISEKRLNVMPEATQCISCATSLPNSQNREGDL